MRKSANPSKLRKERTAAPRAVAGFAVSRSSSPGMGWHVTRRRFSQFERYRTPRELLRLAERAVRYRNTQGAFIRALVRSCNQAMSGLFGEATFNWRETPRSHRGRGLVRGSTYL
jgi:hypothetical protein